MPRYRTRKSFLSPKGLLLSLAVIGLIFGGYYFYRRQNKPSAPAGDSGSETINYAPPTEEERAAGDAQKQENIQDEQNRQNNTSSQTVKPVITFAGQYENQIEVGAFVPDVYEDGGTCTLTATKGSSKVTKQVTGERDATTTRCPTFVIPRSEFPSIGTWNIVVSYSSPTASGSSDSKTLEVK